MSRMEDIIVSDNETTFQYDKDLLTLPVPDLSFTLKKYLDSVKVLVSDDEYRQTEFLVQQFEAGEGKYLQRKLQEKASTERNWLEKWWEDVGYLEMRGPITLMNMGGPGPYSDDVWPPQAGTQIKRASLLLHYTLKIWEFIKREQYHPMKDNKGRPQCMFQFRRIFNTCRVPAIFRDKLVNYFKTESEGECPSHIVVFCKSHIFLLNTLDEAGEILTPPEFEMQLQRIRDQAEGLGPSECVNFLTCLPRDTWAQARSTLVALHPQNYDILEKIQSCVITLALDDVEAGDIDDLAYKSLLGGIENRWCDKALGIGMYSNGVTVSCADHAPAEGLMMVFVTAYVHGKMKEINGVWPGTKAVRPQPPPKHLKFVINDAIAEKVVSAKKLYSELKDLADVKILLYRKYGKSFCKKIKIHPDTYCQLAMQLAYYTIYNRMAPTYETAAIKQFFHGRTETMRSCTMEAYEWCKVMTNPKSPLADRCKLFNIAVEKHNSMMAEACQLKGCDRHLLGLYLLAKEEGREINPLFTDPAFIKSGGGGNFILSTSCIGYTSTIGAVLPMCKDSIGCFYRINDDLLTFFITTWNADKDTDCRQFGDVLTKCLDSMQELLIQGAAHSGARL